VVSWKQDVHDAWHCHNDASFFFPPLMHQKVVITAAASCCEVQKNPLVGVKQMKQLKKKPPHTRRIALQMSCSAGEPA
jgi:hypothetical protein